MTQYLWLIRNRSIIWSFLFVVLLFSQSRAQIPPNQSAEVRQFDAAPFGFVIQDEDGLGYGIRWPNYRKIRRVVVDFGENQPLPDPAEIKVQYWHRIWNGLPGNISNKRRGWEEMDDWTNGQWVDAETHLQVNGNSWTYTFSPITQKEIKGVRGKGVEYRKTLWLRLRGLKDLSSPPRLRIFTDAEYRPLRVRIQFGTPAAPSVKIEKDETGQLEIENGQIVALRALEGENVEVQNNWKWKLSDGASGGIEADLLMAVDALDSFADRTIVTVRTAGRPFSFAADEIAGGQRILVDDFGVLVTNSDDLVTLAAYRKTLKKEFTGSRIYDQVQNADEQTLSHAWDDMPLKHPLYFVHGLPGNRNSMKQHPNGQIEFTTVKPWFSTPKSSRDSERRFWNGKKLEIDLGFPDETLRGGRELKEGYLPSLRTWWQEGSVYYEQTAFLEPLDQNLDDIALDDPSVLFVKVRLVNVSEEQNGQAKLCLGAWDRRERKLKVEQGRAFTAEDRHTRFFMATGGAGELTELNNQTRWAMELKPGQSHNLYFYIPSVAINEDEIRPILETNFETEEKRIGDFWRKMGERGTRIHTPEPWINDFYKAHLRHMMINCYKELDTDLLHAHVGTFNYGVFPNESVMMISDLDRRGYHDEAARNLNAFLHYQGTVSMPGNFQSSQGQFYGAAGHECGGYNKSHGYVMWNMAEHWWVTRDREWMGQAADKLVESCDWVTREREATKIITDGKKSLEYGYLPSGSLEDVTDYWYWLSTNSATVWGFLNLSDALADFGHPEGKRLQQDAQAYYTDFMNAVTESRIRCPVVRLHNGVYVPKFPSRLYERGRSYGWLRETLEGSIFLPAYQLLDPMSVETQWIIDDYEDNLYMSEDYGYVISAFEKFWFSRGGFSKQSDLLDGPLPYLWRDDIKHYLRAYFNGFASVFYPEVRMCTEHALPELGYPTGDHFKTSDEAQSTYWLRLMFVSEQNQDLYLGRAIPRYWLEEGNSVSIERAPSYFGEVSLMMESHADKGEIKVIVDPPQRNAPKTIYLRIRHPQAKPIRSVILNGKNYLRFDVDKEWIILPGNISGKQEFMVKY